MKIEREKAEGFSIEQGIALAVLMNVELSNSEKMNLLGWLDALEESRKSAEHREKLLKEAHWSYHRAIAARKGIAYSTK